MSVQTRLRSEAFVVSSSRFPPTRVNEADRLDESQAAFNQAFARKLDSGALHADMYFLAFVRGDAARMGEELAWAAGKPGDEDVLLSAPSDTEAYYGRLRSARDFSRRAVDSAVRADSKETAALWQVNGALREVEVGNTASAMRGVTAALAPLLVSMAAFTAGSR